MVTMISARVLENDGPVEMTALPVKLTSCAAPSVKRTSTLELAAESEMAAPPLSALAVALIVPT